jgi:alkanesulfonate monooxygenase SsuD/methylene tetrahydromethanopterin reductase-like flavin-dependent oxidoreductase (luciferase family)
MKFGIAYEISVPRPWTRESEKTVYDRCLEQVKLADQLGFDFIWAVEHHFLEEYSHCSSPELFLTACAMITQRIRLGFGIVVCVPEYSSPIRIAERTATLDILSGGRLEVGTGRSATWTELGGFRANPDETKKTWDEFVHCIPKMWTQERYSYQGITWSMPQRTILPKPYQKPHPPLWVAVTSPGTEVDAAERGLGSLGLTFGTVEEQEEKLKRYRRIIRNCQPVGDFVNEQIATINFLYCHEDNAQGIATGRRVTDRFIPLATQFVHNPEAIPTRSGASQGLLATLRRQASGPGAAPPGIAIGNPERITRELKKWEAMGIDCVNFVLNVLEVIPQEQVLDSLRLFAREVMPQFKDDRREPKDDRLKPGARQSAAAGGS